MTTRSTPRTSLAFATIPRRRAAPTNAKAASGPGQVISSEEDRPGSVSDHEQDDHLHLLALFDEQGHHPR
jgi:hypothetical protein